jgi:hypothetical protein
MADVTVPTQVEVHVGEVVNLSVSGAAIRFAGDPLGLRQHDNCTVRIAIAEEGIDQSIRSVVVRKDGTSREVTYRLQFLPLCSPAAAEQRDRVLWRYLLHLQGQQRRGTPEKPRLEKPKTEP